MKKLLVISIAMLMLLTACGGGGKADSNVLKIAGLEGGYGKAGWNQ